MPLNTASIKAGNASKRYFSTPLRFPKLRGAGSSPVGDGPYLSEISATVQLPLPRADLGKINRFRSGCAVAQLRGCRGGLGAGHIGRNGQCFRKVPYRAFIEEFPDLVSNVSEVSSGPLALHGAASPPVPN